MGDLFQRSFNESVTGQLFGMHGASPSSTRLVRDRTGTVSDPPENTGEAKGGGEGGGIKPSSVFSSSVVGIFG